MENSILLNNGEYFSLDTSKFDGEKLTIEGIAHALSNICRFGGHCNQFYSVAQHSVLASQNVSDGCAWDALFHDATEAILTDIPTPLKRLLNDYKKIEHGFNRLVLDELGVVYPFKDEVKHADLRMLATERRDLMNEQNSEWEIIKDVKPYDFTIDPWRPDTAKMLFMHRARFLYSASLAPSFARIR